MSTNAPEQLRESPPEAPRGKETGNLRGALTCPSCRGELLDEAGCWRCPEEEFRFAREDGIPDFILPHRRDELEAFLRTYHLVRAREAWGSREAQYYRDLPYADRTGAHRAVWRIRARTFDCFLAHARGLRPGSRVLDAGAGNCWLSAQLAERGHDVAALDINLDPLDGLGVLGRMAPAVSARIVPVRAEFDAVPFRSGTFEAAVANASAHYSPDIHRTMAELLRVLRSGGRLYILDSPVYRSVEAGMQMVRERDARFTRKLGIPPPERGAGGFLTIDAIRDMGERHRLELLAPGYGLRWQLRPLVARLLGRREPALFQILVIHKE
jgi:SAM-dependent methyltransferase